MSTIPTNKPNSALKQKESARKLKLRVAWTVDDGPTDHTVNMLSAFKNTLGSPIPATWFIQYDRLMIKNYVNFYLDLQKNNKHEIGIHGVSAIHNHMNWFPCGNDKKCFTSVDDAVMAIEAFKIYLKQYGIMVKFVRAPTGLHSELALNLRKVGVPRNQDRIARQIISGQIKVGDRNKNIAKVAASFDTLKKGLGRLNLHLWGGHKTGKITANSWETESAGIDTNRIDHLSNEYIKNFIKNMNIDKSLVILCHDTTAEDVEEVRKDILMMDKLAKENNVEIEYYTMSNLYKQVVGKIP